MGREDFPFSGWGSPQHLTGIQILLTPAPSDLLLLQGLYMFSTKWFHYSCASQWEGVELLAFPGLSFCCGWMLLQLGLLPLIIAPLPAFHTPTRNNK